MSDNNLKILVTGEVKGNYAKLFKRVQDVNKKAGPFDFLFCVGDFFGEDIGAFHSLLGRSLQLPAMPTYVLGPIPKDKLVSSYPDVSDWEAGFELMEGITFLGKSGILSTTQGLRIAYLNGSYDGYGDLASSSQAFFNDRDIESLLLSHQSSGMPAIDILLTTQWPTAIFNHTSVPEDLSDKMKEKIEEESSMVISRLAKTLMPRYHFVGALNYFFERLPYRNHRVAAEQTKNVTRFISIARVANEDKQKWLYAFNCVPAKGLSRQELVAVTSTVTENPFLSLDGSGSSKQESTSSSGQFFYDLGAGGNDVGRNRKRDNDHEQQGRPAKRTMQVDLQNCWFCLASPNVDKSLIVSIGEHCYLALAKGGLTNDHMMVLPIEHIRSTLEIQSQELKKEIQRFKTSLTEYFTSQDKIPVFFERNFKTAHFQLQVIPLPRDKSNELKPAIEKVFQQFECHELKEDSNIQDFLKPGYPYFYLECPGVYSFFIKIDVRKAFFPIQIGRELLAQDNLLDCVDRINWKACVLGDDESKQVTKHIRTQFKPYDFTL